MRVRPLKPKFQGERESAHSSVVPQLIALPFIRSYVAAGLVLLCWDAVVHAGRSSACDPEPSVDRVNCFAWDATQARDTAA
jgi:hypothetical protein